MANTDFDPSAWPMPPSGGQVPPQPIPPPPTQPPPRQYTPQPTLQPPPPQPPAQPPGQAGANLPPIGPSPATSPPDSWTPIPQPPERFLPPAPNRPPSEWGKPWWPVEAAKLYPGKAPAGTYMPTPHAAYGVMGTSAGRLAQWGPPAVSEPATQVKMFVAGFAPILDALSRGAFSANFSRANALQVQTQLGRMRIQQEQMLMQADNAYKAHQALMMQYGDVFEKANIINTPQAALEAEEQIDQLAIINHDNSLREVLHSRGLKGAAAYLQWHDAEARALLAGTTALKKATQSDGTDDDTASTWGETPTGAGAAGAGPGFSFPNLPGRDADTRTAEATTSDADAEAPSDNPYDQQMEKAGYTPQEIDAVHQLYNGEQTPAYADLIKEKGPQAAKIKHKIDNGVLGLQHAVDTTARDPKLTPEEKMQQLAQINPETAAEIKGLHDFTLDPKDLSTKNRAHFTELTKSIFGGDYNEGTYAAAQRWTNQDNPTRKVIDRAANLTQSGLTTLDALNKFSENDSVIQNKFKQWLSGNLTGSDERYKVLFDSLFDLDQHFQAIASFTGTPRVTTLMKQIENLGSTATPMQVRNVIAVNLRSAYQVINNYQNDWEQATHRPTLMPGMTAHNYQIFRDIVRMNPYTGEMPSDAQPESLGVSRSPSEARTGLTKEQKYPPLPMTSIWKLNDDYKRLAADPDPDKQQQARDILHRIGPIIGITGHISGVDDDAARPGS